MARKPKPKPQAEPAKAFDEFADESDGLDDEVSDDSVETVDIPAPSRSRDWRDVERFKEMRELRKLVGDDIDFDIDLDSAR